MAAHLLTNKTKLDKIGNMNYFDQKQYIAQIDKQDKVIVQIERWQAHKTGILHRGFTLTIYYKDQIVLQHRKHPVFDNVIDMTISSHQLINHGKVQDDLEAIYNTLEREWNIKEKDLLELPTNKGNIYYRAKDPNSDYTEHEVCHVYSCKVDHLVLPNFEFAYGFLLKSAEEIKNTKNMLYPLFAPWAKQMIQEGLI